MRKFNERIAQRPSVLVACTMAYSWVEEGGQAMFMGLNYWSGVIVALLLVAVATSAPTVAANQTSQHEKSIYWGDLHAHTAYSMDAYVLNTQTTPEDAYRFAQGGSITLPDGGEHRLKRPLDFAAVTDHAEYFGLINVCRSEPQRPYCKELAEAAAENSRRGFVDIFLPLIVSGKRNCLVDDSRCEDFEANLWQRSIDAAEAANQPGKFTTFIASEWTASPDNLHWHRNLIYANASVPKRAINSFDQPTQEQMWQALKDQCRDRAPCDVIAIPHNGNIGLGGSYATAGHTTKLLGLRAEFEKLVEIHQHKGSSECYPGSMYSDESCDFEIALPIPIRDDLRLNKRELTEQEKIDIANGYVRPTLARGLKLLNSQGVNPFRYGFVGATDSHSAQPGSAEEDNWRGSLGQWDDTLNDRQMFANYNPGGLTAIWAEENTRQALFAALQRREVYATSGTRIKLRVRQTFTAGADCDAVPEQTKTMGASLGEHKKTQQPTFIIEAMQDQTPIAAIDLIKLSQNGDQVDQRVIALGNYPNGRASSCVTWRDSDYIKGDMALWYVRVLEQPTQRWDQKHQIQERAWSSPIWSLE